MLRQPLEQRLATFLSQYRASQLSDELVVRLERFFSVANGRLDSRCKRREQRRNLDRVQLEATFTALGQPLVRARAAGLIINPWSVAGLKRVEVRHAATLAALWRPALGGSAAMTFLDAFLRRLVPIKNPLPSRSQLQRGYVVRTEHCPLGEASERVDLTIEGADFLLAIEVKIDAPEGKKQLQRYHGSITAWGQARGKPVTLIQLAPFAPPADSGVIAACWADVTAAARSSLPRRRHDYRFNDHLIDSFGRHVALL
jgi:hypothetical protein